MAAVNHGPGPAPHVQGRPMLVRRWSTPRGNQGPTTPGHNNGDSSTFALRVAPHPHPIHPSYRHCLVSSLPPHQTNNCRQSSRTRFSVILIVHMQVVRCYCPCFSAYGYCSQNCHCTNCKNREYYEDFVEERVDMIKMKNPRAFDPKIVRVQDASEIEPQSSNAVPENEQWMYANGCRCQKSKCLVHSCECLKHEVRCTSKCQCIDCGNGPRTKYDSNIGKDQSDVSGLTYEEPTMDTMQSEHTLNPNKRPKYF
uniref:CRC domain-containing protein n=1 Tax=Oryza meridionalis TaxID=40149 RepID=A0A0E0DAU4_9ORYZ